MQHRGPKWVRELGCSIRSIAYDFHSRTGCVDMAIPDCHMNGCISLFHQIDPEVQRIETYVGNRPEMFYLYDGCQWVGRLV
jgi:hypothetical protein